MIAHRGASHDRPENTFAAFQAALDQGCDGIELDLQLTADGVPVVFHDRTLERIGGGVRRIHHMEIQELRSVDAGAWFRPEFIGERIPALDEVLDALAARTRLLLEIKAREDGPRLERLAAAVARRVAALPSGADAYLLSFSGSALDAARRAEPGVRTIRNMRRAGGGPGGLPRDAAELYAVCMDQRHLEHCFAAAAGESGLPVLTYTVDDPGTARRVLAAGAKALISNRPGWLRAQLAAGERRL